MRFPIKKIKVNCVKSVLTDMSMKDGKWTSLCGTFLSFSQLQANVSLCLCLAPFGSCANFSMGS